MHNVLSVRFITITYIYMYIRIAFFIELRLRVSRSLRSLAKYHPSSNTIISKEQPGGVRNWRASEASETLSGVYKFELVRYVYIYIYICMEVRMSY